MANNIMPGEHDWMYRQPGVMGFPSPPPASPPQGGGLLGKLGGLFGGGSYGGLLGEDEQKAAQRQALMAMASQLMAAGGPSSTPVSFGQALGPALMAGQQAQQQSGQDMLQAMLLKTKLQKGSETKKPSDVQSYEYAKSNGYAGTFEDWKRVGSAQPQSPAGIQEYEYFSKLSPEQQKQFLSLQRSPVVPQVVTVNGVPTLVDRTGATPPNPLSSLESETDAARQLKEAEAAGTSFGKASGEISAGLLKKGADAKNVQTLLEGADGLIDIATGSKVGATRDAVSGFFGYAPQSAQAAAELKLLEANLMLQQPRMEGPQSNMDQQLYRDMAGQIGNPEVPAPIKKAALRKILELNQKYIDRASTVGSVPGSPTPTPATAKRIRVDAQGNVIGN
jgi:hypothetical protein